MMKSYRDLVQWDQLSVSEQQAILDKINEEMKGNIPQASGWNILLKAYTMGEKIGSIFRPQASIDDDKYRTNVGLVVSMGPLCYTQERFQNIPWCKLGDWVYFTTKTSLRHHNGLPCYYIYDEQVDYVIDHPELGIRDK